MNFIQYPYSRNPFVFFLKVCVPEVSGQPPYYIVESWRPMRSSQGMAAKFAAGKLERICPLRQREPEWDEVKECYILDFYGRVTEASTKYGSFLAQGRCTRNFDCPLSFAWLIGLVVLLQEFYSDKHGRSNAHGSRGSFLLSDQIDSGAPFEGPGDPAPTLTSQVILFGRVGPHDFNLDFAHPIS